MRSADTPRAPRVGSKELAAREPVAGKVAAWEQIEEGRYMPRRTRGSFPGRELG